MTVFSDRALDILHGAGFDADGADCGDYVHARGWKIDEESAIPDGPVSTRVLLIDRNGDIVGEGWGEAGDQALAAAFADYLATT